VKSLARRILSGEVFRDRPPVCVDVGASGELPSDWRILAPYSMCVAFDADDRDFRVEDSATSEWRRLVKMNRLVAENPADNVDFYLTRSPHCSSRLKPNLRALEPWLFHDLFEIEGTVALPAISLPQVLEDIGVSYIDWFKTDSQGTDLRIFRSLPAEIVDRIIVADFEPGILDAYEGEDKLFSLMAYMSARPFFVSDLDVKGSQRIGRDLLTSLGILDRKYINTLLRKSPGWAEISYLNSFEGRAYSQRDLLLGWIFSSIKGQHGHALAVAATGMKQHGDSIFDECRRATIRRLHGRYPYLALRAARSAVSRLLPRAK
jgi:hypothetical protein